MEFVRCIFRYNVFLGQIWLKMRFLAQNTQLPGVLCRLLRFGEINRRSTTQDLSTSVARLRGLNLKEFVRCIFRSNVFLGQFWLKMRFLA